MAREWNRKVAQRKRPDGVERSVGLGDGRQQSWVNGMHGGNLGGLCKPKVV